MGRFDTIVNSSNQSATLPGVNKFTNVVSSAVSSGRFDNIVSAPPKQEEQGFFGKAKSAIGGAVGFLGRILSVGQNIEAGVVEKGLEKIGILNDTGIKGTGAKEGIQKQKSNIDLLHRIGNERGGGILTGQYTPTTSVFGNFVREVPSVAIGTLGDIFLDPVLGPFGVAGKAIKVTGKGIAKGTKAIGEGIEALGKEVPIVSKTLENYVRPAVQQVGDMLGRGFITRFKQRPEFQTLDRQRLLSESLAREDVGHLVSDVIEQPREIQQRITQIIKGEVEVGAPLTASVTPKIVARQSFREVDAKLGEIASKRGLIDPEGKIESQVFSELADAQAGRRIVLDAVGAEGSKTIGQPSTFPEWVSSDLRSRKLFDDVQQSILEKKIPENEKGLRLYTEYLNEYNKRAGIVEKITPEEMTILRDRKELFPLSARKIDTVPEPFPNDEELKILAQPIRAELDRVGESISKLNPKLLDPEVFEANKGTYFPRLYSDYEFPATDEGIIKNAFGSRATSVPKEPFKGRILTEAESVAKGTRIEEAGYPALKRLTQLNITEQRQKFFQEISKMASDAPKPGWIQLSEDKALGNLAGKFLPAAEYRAIAEIRRIPTTLENIYGRALTAWKTFKTAYNPATISRNDLTNFFVLNPLGGVGPHRLDVYFKAARELYTKGPLYQMARKEGLELSTQQAAELTTKASRFYKANEGLVKQFFGKVGDFHEYVKNFYGAQDKFFKMANFIKGVTEDGLNPTKALQRANLYLVDYSEVPELVQWLRKSPVGIPFISFTYGVSKPLAKTLLERPDRLGNFFKILNGIQQLNPNGETPAERQAELDVAPEWLQEGTYLRLPVKDKYGRGQYVDLQYILPFNILEGSSLLPSNPILDLTAALLANRDTFTGRDITLKSDTPLEKFQKQGTFVLSNLLPALTPLVGSSYDKIVSAIQQKPDRNGYVKTRLEALVGILGGIKITPIDATIEAQKRASEKRRELIDLRSQLKSIILNKALGDEERKKQGDAVKGKMKTLQGF